MAVPEMHFQLCILYWIAVIEIAVKYRFLGEATIATKDSEKKEKKHVKQLVLGKCHFNFVKHAPDIPLALDRGYKLSQSWCHLLCWLFTVIFWCFKALHIAALSDLTTEQLPSNGHLVELWNHWTYLLYRWFCLSRLWSWLQSWRVKSPCAELLSVPVMNTNSSWVLCRCLIWPEDCVL